MRISQKTISVCLALSFATAAQAAAPSGWADNCFGADTAGSSLTTDLGGGAYDIVLEAAGTDIWGQSDTGRFVYTPLAGDCEVMATIPSIDQSASYGEWARQGLMVRGSLMNNTVNLFAGRVKGTAASGTRLKLTYRNPHNAQTYDWPGVNGISYATNAPARLRLVRQGDAFTLWGCTNAPAYDQWAVINSYTAALGPALNVGVVVSRWQDLGPDTLTCAFGAVRARNLVTAAPGASSIAVAWVGDSPVTSGTVVGYALQRAAGSGGAFAALAETAAGTLTYDDAAAGVGTSYVYRVYAKVDTGSGTNSTLVGTSLGARRAAVTANPSPAPFQGLAAEYFKPRDPLTLVAARVDPDVNNSWNYAGASVYPSGAWNGLSALDDFRGHWSGTITVPTSGCYGFVQSADDGFYLWVDGVQIMDQGAYLNMREIYSTPVWMEAGRRYPIRVEFYEGGGGEGATLKWFTGADAPTVVPQSALEPFPMPWQHRDVGDSPRFGNASYDYASQAFTLASAGAGVDAATGRDDGHFAWQTAASDCDVVARVSSLSGPAGMGAGLSVRRSLADSATMVALAVVATGPGSGDRALAVSTRAADGAAPDTRFEALPETPAELRLARRGTTVWAYYRTASTGGWVALTNAATSLSGTLYAGLTVFSGDTSQTATGVFDTVTFAYPQAGAYTASVASHQATLTITEKPPMQVRQENDAKANVYYYWSDALSGSVSSYDVYRSSRPDQGFGVIGTTTSGGGGQTYADPIPSTNTLVFYRLGTSYALGALAAGGSNDLSILTKVNGLSDGAATGSGTGLYTAFTRSSDQFPTNLPCHVMTRDLAAWDKGSGTPIVAAAASQDGAAIGPDNFQTVWNGWLVPPYTGYYWFRLRNDDGTRLWINGARAIYFWSWTPTALDYGPLYLEAGKRLPVQLNFQQGSGGGYVDLTWKHGFGLDAGFVTIPAAQLYPLAAPGAPKFVAPGSGSEFGAWRNADINTGRPGHAVLAGAPDRCDVRVAGGGGDVWNNADGFHYVYQELADNFEIEATVNALNEADGWTKAGVMVREGTTAGARNIFLLLSAANGRHLQLRETANAATGNSDAYNRAALNQGSEISPVTFKMVRERGKIACYVNGQSVTYSAAGDLDVSGWNKTLCVGLAVTSHNNGRLSDALFNDVAFRIIYPKGSVLTLR